MNNATTARAPLRHSESASILALQIAGLITREGNAPFAPTEKAGLLKAACDKKLRGEPLTDAEGDLIMACADINV